MRITKSWKIRCYCYGIIARMEIVMLHVWAGQTYTDMCELCIRRRYAIYVQDKRKCLRMSTNYSRTRNFRAICGKEMIIPGPSTRVGSRAIRCVGFAIRGSMVRMSSMSTVERSMRGALSVTGEMDSRFTMLIIILSNCISGKIIFCVRIESVWRRNLSSFPRRWT
jgi:hypothetical protein